MIVVARGGGSLTDLLALSDETLCRTVALLPVPVIASIGHHSDHTLLDDVAAASCSTPTHAAEAAVPLHCNAARAGLTSTARRLANHSRDAVLSRARLLAALSRAPGEHLSRERTALHQTSRELRAAARRHVAGERQRTAVFVERIVRQRNVLARECRVRRPAELEQLRLALAAHDPERTLARGYVLAEDAGGEPLTTAAAARAAGRLTLQFADGRLVARIEEP